MGLFLIWFLFVIIVGYWAEKWNRNPLIWMIVALILSPVVGVIGLLIAGNNSSKCPHCLGHVPEGASACKNCGRTIKGTITPPDDADDRYRWANRLPPYDK